MEKNISTMKILCNGAGYQKLTREVKLLNKEKEFPEKAGQADTIFLLVMDETKNRMKVIGISEIP